MPKRPRNIVGPQVRQARFQRGLSQMDFGLEVLGRVESGSALPGAYSSGWKHAATLRAPPLCQQLNPQKLNISLSEGADVMRTLLSAMRWLCGQECPHHDSQAFAAMFTHTCTWGEPRKCQTMFGPSSCHTSHTPSLPMSPAL